MSASARALSSAEAACSPPAAVADSPRLVSALGDGDDRAGDLVVDGLLLRVPQLPEPADRTDDADRESDLERPYQSPEGGLAHAGELPGRYVADLEPERHHPDRLPATAPEVPEVRDIDNESDDAGQTPNVLNDRADDRLDHEHDDQVDEAAAYG